MPDALDKGARLEELEGKRGLKGGKRILAAFLNSLHGIKRCFATEDAFRQEILLAAVLAALSFYIAHTVNEWLILNGSVFLVLIVELLNTAIERAIDRISFDRHELSREAKDMGSAAVLLSLLFCGLCWGAVILF
jgi:diacylglycerol kinase (ATP)